MRWSGQPQYRPPLPAESRMGSETPPPVPGGTDDGFEEHRIKRPREPGLDLTVGDVARVDEHVDDLVGRRA